MKRIMAGIRIREVNDTKGLFALEGPWDGLLRRSAVDGVFLSWEHTRTWWEVYGKPEMKLRILLAEDGEGKLLGIAPLMVSPGGGAVKASFRYLVIVGGIGDSLSECLDLIIERGLEEEVGAAFADYVHGEMNSDWDVVRFGMVLEGAVALGAFIGRLGELGVEIPAVREHVAPSLELGSTWEEFLGSRSQNFRRGLKVARRKLGDGREIERRLVSGVEEIPGAMASLAELNRKRWGEDGDAFRSAEFEAFHRILAERFLERGWLYLSVIEADGVAIGARYDFVYGDKMWCFQGGWDPSLARVGLGKVMVADVVEWAMARGLKEYDFLAGDARYKQEWSTVQRTLVDFEGTNPTSLRGLAFGVLKTVKKVVMRGGQAADEERAA